MRGECELMIGGIKEVEGWRDQRGDLPMHSERRLDFGDRRLERGREAARHAGVDIECETPRGLVGDHEGRGRRGDARAEKPTRVADEQPSHV